MEKRFVSIWFRHLNTDWFSIREPKLKIIPFVLRTASHGKMVITSANAIAEQKGIYSGMVLADARAIHPEIQVADDIKDLPEKLLKRLGEWCIRFSPVVAMDPPDGLLLDASGCTYLWGGDNAYVGDITRKLNKRGYDVRVAMADTPGVACGVARFGEEPLVVQCGNNIEALMALPPEALRLEPENIARLHKLGFHQIKQFSTMPRSSLRRRFGTNLIAQLDKALGKEFEPLEAIIPVEPYHERLPCMDPILTATGIGIALMQLLDCLCRRLRKEQKGLRQAIFKCYRVDGKIEQVEVGTNRPSHHVEHLYKLFSIKLSSIEPGLGIELFILEAPKVEDHQPVQEKMWQGTGGLEDIRVSELIDRFAAKAGVQAINRFLPAEHHWPERSVKASTSLQEKLVTSWRSDKPRPIQLLSSPERIEVTAPIPDYPPMLFRHRGKLHKIIRADGPERIEQEWWLQEGKHRDYYRVEDEDGHRYWIFRLGHYDGAYGWFLHGYFS